MKILFKNKIVEAYRFPLSEAISFSILVWTLWGMGEAFYWQKVVPWLEPGSPRLDPRIFLISFSIYLGIACVMAVLWHITARLALTAARQYEAYRFRGLTLAGILGSFFAITLYYNLHHYLFGSSLSKGTMHIVLLASIVLALLFTLYIYFKGTNVGFRLRRPGAMMLSVFILSFIFSFIRFPLFSPKPAIPSRLDLKTSASQLMAYHYFQTLISKK